MEQKFCLVYLKNISKVPYYTPFKFELIHPRVAVVSESVALHEMNSCMKLLFNDNRPNTGNQTMFINNKDDRKIRRPEAAV